MTGDCQVRSCERLGVKFPLPTRSQTVKHNINEMTKHKTALILDKIDRGTIQTSLQTNNYTRILKLLNSSEKNWESICKILEEDIDNKIIVLAKFTEYTLFRMCSPYYSSVVKRLLSLLKKKKHLIFIYKNNLFGKFSYFEEVKINSDVFEIDNLTDFIHYSATDLKSWLYQECIEESEVNYILKVRNFIKELNDDSLNILPYEKLIDVEISGQSFIENIAEGLLFRIYVPKERIWSNEFDKFITLFRDYASIVSNKELKITQNRTDLGIICSLYSLDESIVEEKINDLYKEFTGFMDLCSTNPSEAQKFIDKLEIDNSKKNQILHKYIKESQRLLLDLKQERELKFLSIKHRFESELNEYTIDDNIIQYIEDSLPNAKTTRSLLNNSTKIINNQTININPQIISKVDGIVCSEINGNIQFTSEEREIEKLIEKYTTGISETAELQSSLYELKDSSASNEQKRGAWQKLYGFLGKVADKVGDVGITLLTKYIEQQMNG